MVLTDTVRFSKAAFPYKRTRDSAVRQEVQCGKAVCSKTQISLFADGRVCGDLCCLQQGSSYSHRDEYIRYFDFKKWVPAKKKCEFFETETVPRSKFKVLQCNYIPLLRILWPQNGLKD